MHKPNSADVRRAFERMLRVTGAEATIERTAQPEGPTLWRLDGDALTGTFYGSASAALAIESYTTGWVHGREDANCEEAQAHG